jgi:hypothetical protein
MWGRTWIDSSSFRNSPYRHAITFDPKNLFGYCPLYHCVVHGLNIIVRYLLDKSSPLLSFDKFPSTLETAVLLNNLAIVTILLRRGAGFGNSLRLSFRQRNNAMAMVLIRQGCDVRASDLVLAAPWCSPETMLNLLKAIESLSLDDFALVLNSSLIGRKEVTKLLLDHLPSRRMCASKANSTFDPVHDLLITASKLGLSRTIDYLTNPAESPLPYQGRYDSVLFAATMSQRPAVIASLLNSEAKSRISYVSFATVVRRTTTAKDYATFRPLLRHIPLGTHSSRSMLRIAIACDCEPLAIRLLSDGAGVDVDGLWVDDISLLTAVILQQNYIVKRFMLSKTSFPTLCNVLRGKGVVQDVCEILYAYGAKLAIHRVESRAAIMSTIFAHERSPDFTYTSTSTTRYSGVSSDMCMAWYNAGLVSSPGFHAIVNHLMQVLYLIRKYNLHRLIKLAWSEFLELLSRLPLKHSLEWLKSTARLLPQDRMSRCSSDIWGRSLYTP